MARMARIRHEADGLFKSRCSIFQAAALNPFCGVDDMVSKLFPSKRNAQTNTTTIRSVSKIPNHVYNATVVWRERSFLSLLGRIKWGKKETINWLIRKLTNSGHDKSIRFKAKIHFTIHTQST